MRVETEGALTASAHARALVPAAPLTNSGPANGTLAKLQPGPHANGDAARQLPRLTIALAETIRN
jgi:hypothetical protein